MKAQHPFLMPVKNEILLVTIPVEHVRPFDVVTIEDVSFRVFRDENKFKAVPQVSAEERNTMGIAEELVFVYRNPAVVWANNMEEESMNVIKSIILELEVLDLI